MTDAEQKIRAALAAGAEDAVYTHPRDSNKWEANRALSESCTAESLNTMLAELDALRESHPEGYWVRQHAAARSAELAMRREIDGLRVALLDDMTRAGPQLLAIARAQASPEG